MSFCVIGLIYFDGDTLKVIVCGENFSCSAILAPLSPIVFMYKRNSGYFGTMNNDQTIEIDNSPAALYVKSWMKKDNPHLTQFQLEEKWQNHLEHLNQVAKVKGIKKSNN